MRIRPLTLAEQYQQIGGYLGGIWVTIGLIMAAPLLAYPIWGSGPEELAAILVPSGALAAVGGLLAWLWWPRQPTIPPFFLGWYCHYFGRMDHRYRCGKHPLYVAPWPQLHPSHF